MSNDAKIFPGSGRYDEPGAIMVRSPNGSERWYASAVYTVVEAGEQLGLKRSAAMKHAKDGTLPTITLNGRRHVTAAALDRLLNPGDYPEQPAAEPFGVGVGVGPRDEPVPAPAEDDDNWPRPARSTAVDSLLSYEKPKPRTTNPNPLRTERLNDFARVEPEGFPEPATADDLDDADGRTLPSGVWVGRPIYY